MEHIHEGLLAFYPHSILRVEKIHEFSYVIPDWTEEIREPK